MIWELFNYFFLFSITAVDTLNQFHRNAILSQHLKRKLSLSACEWAAPRPRTRPLDQIPSLGRPVPGKSQKGLVVLSPDKTRYNHQGFDVRLIVIKGARGERAARPGITGMAG